MDNTSIVIRPLREDQFTEASLLVWRVFLKFEAPDYAPAGIETFRAFIDPDALRDQFRQGTMRTWGAFHGEELIGILAGKNTHISLLFVEETFHRQGIARTLFEQFRAHCQADPSNGRITVNSSPYAVPVYLRLGFAATGPESTTDGIRYTPMEYQL